MKQSPIIVFVTTCKGRLEHLEKTLPRNISDNADYPNAKFVVLDYGWDQQLAIYIAGHGRESITDGRLAYFINYEPGPFHMAHAKNMAHRLGIFEGADILVNLDADNLISQYPTFLTRKNL
jgi:hypothetical protein